MGTIFEPFIIAFWVFIIALVGFVLAGLIYVIRDSIKDTKDKKTKED